MLEAPGKRAGGWEGEEQLGLVVGEGMDRQMLLLGRWVGMVGAAAVTTCAALGPGPRARGSGASVIG